MAKQTKAKGEQSREQRREQPREQPLDRAIAVMTAVVSAARPVSVADIASECALPVPTAHRLVAQLESRGLLKRALGTRALEAALRSDRPHQILLALSAELGEHVQVGIRSDNHVLYVDTARAPRAGGGLSFEQGRRAPLYCTSIGKLFLAEMTDDALAWWLAHTPLVAVTANTITQPDRLREIAAKVRATGWATSDDEFAVGVVGCAVPIRDAQGRLVAGLGISVPSAHLPAAGLIRFQPRMQQAAAAITAAIA
jgi:DNA-binding IclR family transcriptional regulator